MCEKNDRKIKYNKRLKKNKKKNGGDNKMMEVLKNGKICHHCGALLDSKDYLYNLCAIKTPDVKGGYVCHCCGFYELNYIEKKSN